MCPAGVIVFVCVILDPSQSGSSSIESITNNINEIIVITAGMIIPEPGPQYFRQIHKDVERKQMLNLLMIMVEDISNLILRFDRF